MTYCRRCFVSGRVQGVGFRAATAKRARSLGVTGYARNLPDGRVEVLACGADDAVDTLVQFLWKGPALAAVRDVVSAPADDEAPAEFATG